MKLPILEPSPNIDHFVDVIKGRVIPKRPPLCELFLDRAVEKEIGEQFLGLQWIEPVNLETKAKYWDFRMAVYRALGYDYLWVYGAPSFAGDIREGADGRAWAESGQGVIRTWDDFDHYSWPRMTDEMLWDYIYVSEHLPEGMGMFVANGDGFLEAVMDNLVGYEPMCEMSFDDPALLKAIVDQTGEIIYDACVKMLDVPKAAGIFMGDDMGFTTSMLFSPEFYRTHTLPWHKKLARAAHERGKLYMLHSCGLIDPIMPDLIDDVGIDAKHSYQDGSYDVTRYKKEFGDQIAILGGVDVDLLCRLEEAELRQYCRGILEACAPGGRYAFGTGNSVADYIPLHNYFIMLEEWQNFH